MRGEDRVKPDAAAFFETIRSGFDAAGFKNGTTERFFQIGSHSLRLCFANARAGVESPLAHQMTRALEHLATPPTLAPELNVLLWDDALTGTQLPSFPWQAMDAFQQRDMIQALNTARIYVTYNKYFGLFNAFDAATHTALFWLSDARRVPTHEWSAPLRNILHWFLMRNGAHLIHGGAVGTATGGVLLAGKGGSGKSTSAVACLNSGLAYAADDYCVVAGETAPTVYSMYSSSKLDPPSLERVSHTRAFVVNPDQLKTEKAVVMLAETWQSKLILQFPLRAIFLPHVTGLRDTALMPATHADSVRALTLSTISLMPRTDTLAVQHLNHLIKTVPVYHLELGTDMPQIPQVISKFLGVA